MRKNAFKIQQSMKIKALCDSAVKVIKPLPPSEVFILKYLLILAAHAASEREAQPSRLIGDITKTALCPLHRLSDPPSERQLFGAHFHICFAEISCLSVSQTQINQSESFVFLFSSKLTISPCRNTKRRGRAREKCSTQMLTCVNRKSEPGG